ncbi:MAG TPA: DUF3048 domain-containing protein, partial [Oceanobacillus sp.]|nr:DUF3048 domain-containing protein [Oceanobacillus sp.]
MSEKLVTVETKSTTHNNFGAQTSLQTSLMRGLIFLSALLLTACYTGFRTAADGDVTFAPTATSTPEPTPTAIPGLIGPEFAPNVNPLTGLTVDDPAILERRPMVVKISNAPPLVRPQAGLNAADIVFEHYAEGGLTRFSAIFYSQ